jgi:hypothetical protein
MKSWAAGLLALLGLSAAVPAQNLDHPGRVHADGLGWVTPEEARQNGFFEYRFRWFPEKLRKKLEKWERLDPKHAAWKEAYKAKTKNYRITTNAPRFILESEIKPFLDELFQTYVRVFRDDFGLKGKAVNKKFIKIFYGYESYFSRLRSYFFKIKKHQMSYNIYVLETVQDPKIDPEFRAVLDSFRTD